MADDKVDFELVSPDRLLMSDSVEMVVVPGTEGYFGVLPGHAPMISTLKPGVIDVYNNGSLSERLFVSGGFAEVNTERCTVLAQDAEDLKEVVKTRAAVEAKISDLREDIADSQDQQKRVRLEKELELSEAKLQVIDAHAAAA